MGGEAGTSKTHCAAFPDGLDKAGPVGEYRGLDLRRDGLLAVRFDLHRLAGAAVGGKHFRDGCDRAGYTGVYRYREGSLRVSDFLPYLYGIPHLDERGTGGAHVHQHGDPHLSRQRQLHTGGVFGSLVVRKMNAVEFFHGNLQFQAVPAWSMHSTARHIICRRSRSSSVEALTNAGMQGALPGSKVRFRCRQSSRQESAPAAESPAQGCPAAA